MRKHDFGQRRFNKRLCEFHWNRSSFVLIEQSLNHVSRHVRIFLKNAADRCVHNTRSIDFHNIAGRGVNFERLVFFTRTSLKPTHKFLFIKHSFPLVFCTNEDISTGKNRKNVKQFNFEIEMILETESFTFVQQKNGISKWGTTFHAVGFVLA
jgi:hypothetical protein